MMDTNEGRAKDEAERVAFETWCCKRWAGDRGALTIREDGEYLTGHVQFAWCAYQAASTPSPAPEVGGAIAWQERQQTREGWTSWYDASAKTAMGKGPGLSEVLNGIKYQWRPLFAAPQPADVMGVLAECVAAMEMKQRVTMWEQDGDRSKFSAALESARRALAAGALQAEHPLDALMPEICQLIDAVKIEWQQQGCWSEWDQSVRDRIAAYNIAKMKGASAGADAAGAVPEGVMDLQERCDFLLHMTREAQDFASLYGTEVLAWRQRFHKYSYNPDDQSITLDAARQSPAKGE